MKNKAAFHMSTSTADEITDFTSNGNNVYKIVLERLQQNMECLVKLLNLE